MQELARLETIIAPWEEVRRRLDDAGVLIELAQEEADPNAYEADLRAELDAVRERLAELEMADLLSGEHDAANARFIDVPADDETKQSEFAI